MYRFNILKYGVDTKKSHFDRFIHVLQSTPKWPKFLKKSRFSEKIYGCTQIGINGAKVPTLWYHIAKPECLYDSRVKMSRSGNDVYWNEIYEKVHPCVGTAVVH